MRDSRLPQGLRYQQNSNGWKTQSNLGSRARFFNGEEEGGGYEVKSEAKDKAAYQLFESEASLHDFMSENFASALISIHHYVEAI